MSNAAIVGGQFGSEGKGLIAGYIARDYDHHVRVGAANAGHTVYTNNGIGWEDPNSWEKHVMQQIPCAAYANPDADLYIGPGALISADIFVKELDRLRDWRLDHDEGPVRVFIDRRAHVITPWQVSREAATDLSERIGSTSATAREGIGTAQADRVMRDRRCWTVEDWFGTAMPDDTVLCDVPALLATKDGVLLEGTQGTGLSLTTGSFPYVTSRNTTAAGLCADAGFAPTRLDRVILVCRTFPIRVAGNSGPFHRGSEEIDWATIDIDPEDERTTVTKKVRRVATFSLDQVAESVALNGATEIALTFADYLDPRISGEDSRSQGAWDSLGAYPAVADMVADVQDRTRVPVTYVGTGPRSVLEVSIP